MAPTTPITASGRRTSMRLEPCFTTAFEDVARRIGVTPSEIAGRAVAAHPDFGRTSAVRTFILTHYVQALAVCEARVAS